MADESRRVAETREGRENGAKIDVGVTLKDRCKSEELRKRLDIEDVADVVRKSRLRWFGHLERKEGETGYQLAEIWLSQEMLERVDQGKGEWMLWKTI